MSVPSIPEAAEKKRGDLTISPFYTSAVGSITRPDRFVFVSRYLVERWLPELGPNAFSILVFLRRECYHNRETGELRNKKEISLPEIAKGCGLSVSTIRRELQNNAALQKFISVQPEYAYDDHRGGFRKDKNSYIVLMDDPIHEDDKELLQERIREVVALREKGGEDPKARALKKSRLALRQNELTQDFVATMPFAPHVKMNEGECQNATPPCQNDLTLKESSKNSQNQDQTLSVLKEINFVEGGRGEIPQREKPDPQLDGQTARIVAELRDYGSERRHRQLIGICQDNNLMSLIDVALGQTRARLADEKRLGPLEKPPAAYYIAALKRLLADEGVHVPARAEVQETLTEMRAELDLSPEATREQIREALRSSLGLEEKTSENVVAKPPEAAIQSADPIPPKSDTLQIEKSPEWASLTESQRRPFVKQAEAELRKIVPEPLSPRMLESRSRSLFEQRQR